MTSGEASHSTLGALVLADVAPVDIPALLESLEFVDALVVVSRQEECTRAFREAGVEVVEVQPTSDHRERLESARGGFALDCDWILLLEGDDRVSLDLREELLRATRGPRSSVYRLRVMRYLCGVYLRHGGWETREVRLAPADYFLSPPGRAQSVSSYAVEDRFDSPLVQLGQRGIRDRIHWLNRISEVEKHHVRRADVWALVKDPAAEFLRGFISRAGFRDGLPGFLAAALESLRCFLRVAKAWELQVGDQPPLAGDRSLNSRRHSRQQ